jgi:hypothetical protein
LNVETVPPGNVIQPQNEPGPFFHDHLGDIRIVAPALARGYGFGLGFAVRKET